MWHTGSMSLCLCPWKGAFTPDSVWSKVSLCKQLAGEKPPFAVAKADDRGHDQERPRERSRRRMRMEGQAFLQEYLVLHLLLSISQGGKESALSYYWSVPPMNMQQQYKHRLRIFCKSQGQALVQTNPREEWRRDATKTAAGPVNGTQENTVHRPTKQMKGFLQFFRGQS